MNFEFELKKSQSPAKVPLVYGATPEMLARLQDLEERANNKADLMQAPLYALDNMCRSLAKFIHNSEDIPKASGDYVCGQLEQIERLWAILFEQRYDLAESLNAMDKIFPHITAKSI